MHLEALVNKYDPGIDTSLYISAESLIDGIKEQSCDLILLDIEMGGMNGFAAAKKLINMQNPPLIVFVTNSGEYIYRGYGVAFRYLPKPVVYTVLADVLSAAIAKLLPQKLTITADGRCHVLPINDILYLETFGHSLFVHTKKDKIECRMNLSEAEALLPGNAFVSPHKGYLVNLDFVETVDGNEITLGNDAQIPISRRRKQEFEQALFRFVRGAR